MIRPLAYFGGRPYGAWPLLALALLTVIGVGSWALARVGGKSTPTGQPFPETLSAPATPARNLALQPSALLLGRRLGRRFLKAGREVSVLKGTLTTGSDSRPVIVRRVQGEGGEEVEVMVAGRGAPVTWDAVRGALQAGRPADAEAAALADRLAADAPDQFVLAQLRGASYFTVARNVRADEGGADGYSGPLHDVVRVGEPNRGEGPAPKWRLYFLNTETGLIDKVVSEEGGEMVEALLTGWAVHEGELQPSRITWSRGGQVFMELAVHSAAHGPRL